MPPMGLESGNDSDTNNSDDEDDTKKELLFEYVSNCIFYIVFIYVIIQAEKHTVLFSDLAILVNKNQLNDKLIELWSELYSQSVSVSVKCYFFDVRLYASILCDITNGSTSFESSSKLVQDNDIFDCSILWLHLHMPDIKDRCD